MPADLEPVYRRLKSILEPYGQRMHVTDERPMSYGIDTAPDDERNPTTWFGCVRLGKRYVSYYLMPVYVDPSLADTISVELKRHMQGKSCFTSPRSTKGYSARSICSRRLATNGSRATRHWGSETCRARHGPPSGGA